MKQNKFRVWCRRRKGWLTPNDHSLHCSSNWMMDIFTGEIIDFVDSDNQYSPDPEPTHYIEGIEVIKESPYVVQQWTGIVDVNGKEIYDGDIIKLGTYYFEIVWEDYPWSCDDHGALGQSQDTQRMNRYMTDGCEVAGNIFENEYLLK